MARRFQWRTIHVTIFQTTAHFNVLLVVAYRLAVSVADNMSHYVTPFLVLNFGSEMVFVVAQRLQAQNVTPERTSLVLDEIISVLISKQLMTELSKPQATYNHEAVRDIIEDVTQSSVMRLDTISMGKLWDLITMVFKWQITISKNVIPITLRHLYEIENYVTNPETQIQLHKVQNLIDNFNKILSPQEKDDLHDDILYWLKDSNVRVSLLLRMGLQGVDGSFITTNLDPIAEDMLRNLGENIYAVTQNGKILEEKNGNNQREQQPEVNELQLFVDQMLGERKMSDTGKMLRLSIDCKNGNEGQEGFGRIDVNTEDQQIHELMGDLEVEEKNEEICLRDDLLEMIGGADVKGE